MFSLLWVDFFTVFANQQMFVNKANDLEWKIAYQTKTVHVLVFLTYLSLSSELFKKA